MDAMQIPNPPTSSNANSSDFNFDVFGLLQRKSGTIAFFILLAMGLSLLYYVKAPKTYESTAKVFIDERSGSSINVESDAAGTSSVERYIEIVESVSVLSSALDEGRFDEFESMADVEDILSNLRNNLSAKPTDATGKSGVMQLAFRGPVPEECESILRTVVASFGKYIQDSNANKGGQDLETIQKLTKEMGTRFKEIEGEIRELSAKPELQFKDGMVSNQHQIQQAKLQEELDELRRQRTRLDARLGRIEDAAEKGLPTESMIAEALQELNDGALSGYVTTHQEYLRLRMREQELIGQFGEKHPEMIAIRKQLVVVNQMRMEELAALRTDASDVPEDDLSVVKSLLGTKLDLIEAMQTSILEEMGKEKEKASAIAADVELLASLQRERDRMEQTYFASVNKLNEYNALKDYDWRNMQVLDPPTKAEQVIPSLPVSLAGGLLLGTFLGFGFVALQELAEKTFRSPDEIADRLGTRVVAQIGEFRARRKNANYKNYGNDLLMLHAPTSLQAESFRALRTSLFFKAQTDGTKIVQITSPSPGDGKSSISANLAVAIAQSDRSVCLIDCDFRRPTQNDRFGIKNIVGMTSVLVGESDLDSAIQPTDLPRLSVICSGPQYANPSELLTSNQFPKMLDELAERFDFVIVDTPPVLPVTDPSIISNFVDAIFMVIRIRKGVQVSGRRAVEALDTVNAKLDGIVVNGIRRKDRFGDRESYGYGSYGGNSNYSSRKSGTNNVDGKVFSNPEQSGVTSKR